MHYQQKTKRRKKIEIQSRSHTPTHCNHTICPLYVLLHLRRHHNHNSSDYRSRSQIIYHRHILPLPIHSSDICRHSLHIHGYRFNLILKENQTPHTPKPLNTHLFIQ